MRNILAICACLILVSCGGEESSTQPNIKAVPHFDGKTIYEVTGVNINTEFAITSSKVSDTSNISTSAIGIKQVINAINTGEAKPLPETKYLQFQFIWRDANDAKTESDLFNLRIPIDKIKTIDVKNANAIDYLNLGDDFSFGTGAGDMAIKPFCNSSSNSSSKFCEMVAKK